MISGILASPGIAFGRALCLQKEYPTIDHRSVAQNQLEEEVANFLRARDLSVQQLAALEQQTEKRLGREAAEIFSAHSLMVMDEFLITEIIDHIRQKHLSAATATQQVIEQQALEISQLDDSYLRARAADIRDVGVRLLKNIQKIPFIDLSTLSEPVILVAEDLSPSETAQLNLDYVLGLITDGGSRTSHTAIIARSLEIPAIVGTNDITKQISNGDYVVIDALNNAIYINPEQGTLEQLRSLQQSHQKEKDELAKLKDLPAVTIDGYQVELGANIGHLRDLEVAIRNGTDAIGLYRTEFLFMERDSIPSEEEQFAAYKEVAERMGTRKVIIRTVDIGGDKRLSYVKLPQEENPFLGCRGIRLYMQDPFIIETQLRAILRASFFGNLWILFPMIISVEEIQHIKSILSKLKGSLDEAQVPFNHEIKIGVMVETPAAALIINHLAQEVDFFSIGTNDLAQYTLAVDRGNKLIAHLYNHLAPSMLTLIKQVVDAAHQAGKWVGMCGEMAGDPKATKLLLGFGLDELSMSSGALLQIKKIIRSTKMANARLLAEQALTSSTTEAVLDLVS